MEKLQKQRKPVRALYTKTFNELIEHLASDQVDIESAHEMHAKLERLSTELSSLDEKILDLLLDDAYDDDAYEREYNAIECYRGKMDAIRLRMANISSGRQTVADHVSVVSSTVQKKNLKLPKLELNQYGGDVKDWLGFWSMFKRIHEDNEIEPEDKFQYLIQSTKPDSRARELINSFPATAENYPKVIETLTNRFGREDLLIEYYTRELINLVIQNTTRKNDKSGIAVLYDKLECQLRALESIGVTRDKHGSMLFPLVESCLPEEVLRVWLRNQTFASSDPDNARNDRLEALLDFLRKEVEGEERITFAQAGFSLFDKKKHEKTKRRDFEDENVPTANSLFVGKSEGRKQRCIFCNKLHDSKECHIAQQMSLEEKREKVAKEKCCFSCLRLGHRAKNCKANLRCLLCKRQHTVIMCPQLSLQKAQEMSEPKTQEKPETNISMNIHSATKEVLLQTLCVKLKHKGKEKVVRALIDSGSQRSYILQKTANEMGYSPLKTETMIHKLFGGTETCEEEHNLYEVGISSCDGSYTSTLLLIGQKVICGKIPRLKFGPWMKELKTEKIWISDMGSDPPEVEILLGADVAAVILMSEVRKLTCGLLAVKTQLGWTVTGKMEENNNSLATETTSLFIQSASITDLWNLETIGISDPSELKSREYMEEAARRYFLHTVKVSEGGRYEVALPWTESRQFLRNNKEIAERRLLCTTTRLLKERKYEEYGNVFKEWENEGIIEEVLEDKEEEFCYYLPHRGVFKENSTTNVRPVFDGSSKSKETPSLNECLEKGPNLLLQIPALLLMFRKNSIGVISDIRKAFLQISVREEDRNYLRFLWWKDETRSQLKVLRHCRVVFGLNCSPFLLEGVLDLHLQRSEEHQETAERLRHSFYVDNCIISVNTEEELYTFIEEATALLAKAQMELRKWEYTGQTSFESNLPEMTSVLGLRWNKTEDVIACEEVNLITNAEKVTRRNVLSAAQRIFDPIGFTCPVSLLPKLLLQESWKKNMSWDEEMEDDMKGKFENWREELGFLHEIKIPRQIAPSNTQDSWSLHTFCDASHSAYAAVVFLRSEEGQKTHVTLLQAKSRVAPLKNTTIPRLELLACVIGARLAHSAKQSLGVENIRSFYWTDSMTALSWIKGKDVWGTFVQNRVKEIKQMSEPDCWNHVPGMSNPADLPSRGCSAAKLVLSKWWEGPSWLKLQDYEWPKEKVEADEEVVNRERKKGISLILVSAETQEIWYLRYFSKYTKVLRMVAWILRFIHNAKPEEKKVNTKELNVEELQRAEITLLKIVKQEKLTGREHTFKSLNVFEDKNGLLRVQTRIIRRRDDEEFLTPILLPSDHKLVYMMIMEKHVQFSHAGVQVLLSTIRERFWIINGRKTIRKVISGCIRCRRYQAKGITTKVAHLPEDRVRDASVFEITGVDLAGPLHLRGGEKTWIVIYTCAVFRAVHFELVKTLSTSGFLQALRRFIARRGRPATIYSDNGTNFTGAENLFGQLDWTTLNKETTNMRITWKFNPPTAAWWGGFWERIDQMMKKLLRRVLGRVSLDYEEMLTVLADCEATINSRPLTYLSEDPEDMVALTPAMFLQDIPRVGVPDIDSIDRVILGKRFRYVQLLREQLRKRFRSEYLGILRVGKNNRALQKELKIGDVVLVGNNNTRRIEWPLGKIVEVYPGRDNIIRVVQVKTASGELKRPVQNIYPLEADPIPEVEVPRLPQQNKQKTVSAEEAPRVLITKSGRKIRLPSRLRL